MESAQHYNNLLRKIFEESILPQDEALAHGEVRSIIAGNNFPSEKIYGRHHDKYLLLSKLVDWDNTPGIQLSFIPIVGGSGIGKTALARLVYEDAWVEEHFELRAWVTVAEQEFSLKHAARGILKSAIGMACSLDELYELDEMVRDTLQSQKCLIVFDGIESMSKDSWLHMNRCWFKFLDLGSKVLITTASKDVASLVAEQSFEVKVKQLTLCDGWSLFRFVAFENSEGVEDIMLPSVCEGNPLLLKLLGSLIRYDRKMRDLLLDDILFPSSWDASATVLLCLWALPLHLRRCLAFCACFPKGYALSKVKIVDMWIADGLIKPSVEVKSLVDIGGAYFDQLLCRSFFTDITRDQNDNNNIIEFRIPTLIHKMVRDVARVIYKEKLGLIGSVGEDAAHLSLFPPLARKYKSRSIQTLVFWPTLHFGSNLNYSLLDFQELRSLDLSCSGIRYLSGDIRVLRELRYLNLSYTLIEKLPDSFTDLSSLQTLDLSWCYHLKNLPEGLSNMIRMSHLDLSRCESLSCFPSGIGALTSLSTMPLFVLGKDRGCAGLQELGLLNQLRGRLEIRNLESVREIAEAQGAKLDQKRLLHLELSWSQSADDCYEVLELLQPNQQLKVLNLTGYTGYEFPQWISSIKSLTKICFTDCGCKKLPSLGQLPSLKELQLKGMTNLKRIGPEFYGDGGTTADVVFHSLEQLEVYDLPELLAWSGASSVKVFLNLKSLTIEGCPKLQSLPSFPTLPDFTVSNSNKEILSSFTSSISLLINDMELRPLATFHALKKLILRDVQDKFIDDFFQNMGKTLPALEHLGILHCHELRLLDLCNVSSLKKLHIVDCLNVSGIRVCEEKDARLIELILEDCPQALANISFQELPFLRKLIVKNCSEFTIYVVGFKKLKKLEYLLITGCPRMEDELQTHHELISHIPCIIVGNHKCNYNDWMCLKRLPPAASERFVENSMRIPCLF